MAWPGFTVAERGFLRRVHPLVKVACAAAVFVVSVALHSVPAALAYFGLVFLLLAASGMARLTVRILLVLSPLALLIVAVNYLIAPNMDGSIIAGLRILFFGMSMALFAFTTSPAELVRALESVRFPRMLTLGVLIAMRFTPVFIEECGRISQSVRMRGGAFRRNLYFYYRALLVPLIYRIFTVSDTLALSLHARGFQPDGPRTAYRHVRFRALDAAFLILFMAASCTAAVI